MRRAPWLVLVGCWTLAFAGSAEALVVISDGTRAKTTYFGAYAYTCDAPATVSLAAPAGSTHLVPQSLGVGETVTAWDDDEAIEGFATISDVQVDISGSPPRVQWTATPDPALCDPNPVFRTGWYSADRRFEVSYRQRLRFRLSRRDAVDLTEEALVRRFPYYPNYSQSRMQCRHSAIRARCLVGFWAGDTSFSGVVKSRISTTGDHRRLLWSYRLRVVHTNEYCLFVTHTYPCTTTYRKSRLGVRAPGWLL